MGTDRDRHTNAAGVEFVTVACSDCGFRHAHRSELGDRAVGSPPPPTYPTPVTDQREMAGWMRRENEAYGQGRRDAVDEIRAGLDGVRRNGGMIATADVQAVLDEVRASEQAAPPLDVALVEKGRELAQSILRWSSGHVNEGHAREFMRLYDEREAHRGD